MKRFLPLLAVFALCGCGPGYTFSPYVGQQQNWTTRTGAYTKIVDKITIYPSGQLPARPYMIIGGARSENEEGIAKAVREQGGDAAIISTKGQYRTGTVAWAGPGFWVNEPVTATVVTANVIKYK